jgi:hypothetical protein
LSGGDWWELAGTGPELLWSLVATMSRSAPLFVVAPSAPRLELGCQPQSLAGLGQPLEGCLARDGDWPCTSRPPKGGAGA